MSCNSYFTADHLIHRSRKEGVKTFFTMPAGAKAAAKKSLHRAARQQQSRVVLAELVDLASEHDVRLIEASKLELMADAFLAQADAFQADAFQADAFQAGGDHDSVLSADAEDCATEFELSPELCASLPDWLIEQLEATGGSAFEMLSLLEVRQPGNFNKQFAVSREDDGYLNEDN